MKKVILSVLAVPFILAPAVMLAQSGMASKGATYITDEEVKAVNALPGVDRTIRVVDIGNENFAVGIIHRGATGGAARGAAPAGAAAGAARGVGAGAAGGAARGAASAGAAGAAGARGAAPAAEPCGEQSTAPPTGGTPGAIAHDQQTEGYLIVSGSGTLVTGGKIVNGRKSPPEGDVTKILNGPSCSGMTVGDVVKKVVKTGDIIIIPAGVPHGWSEIPEHVDYLSFRPSARVLEAGYVNPALKK
jgi:mannose-6-phosphate isomerase-like protein (cupin superfamily)